VGKDLAKSARFTDAILKEFQGAAGSVAAFDGTKKKLAQNLFVAIDNALRVLESKRSDKNKPAYVWDNCNLALLATSAMYRIDLGLDALIPNHIWPIPYLNGKTKKYDLDLRIGYVGKDICVRKFAYDDIVDIRYELVHESDTFEAVKGRPGRAESYVFEIKKPFNRGDVIGGFGFIEYADERKNKLVLVTLDDFSKSKRAAKSQDFWSKHPKEMQLKTIVHRTASKIPLDPDKMTASYSGVIAEENQFAEAEFEEEIAENANQTLIDVEPDIQAREGADAAMEAVETVDEELENVVCPLTEAKMDRAFCDTECANKKTCKTLNK
jgi:recombination protein RecT